MSSAEEIQAAIDKLTSLRDRSIAGPYRSLVASGDHSYVVANGEAVALIASNDGDNEAVRKPTADLIVTLHRTIDAQLHLLRETVFQMSGAPEARGFIGNEFNLIMQLVHAINGETS